MKLTATDKRNINMKLIGKLESTNLYKSATTLERIALMDITPILVTGIYVYVEGLQGHVTESTINELTNNRIDTLCNSYYETKTVLTITDDDQNNDSNVSAGNNTDSKDTSTISFRDSEPVTFDDTELVNLINATSDNAVTGKECVNKIKTARRAVSHSNSSSSCESSDDWGVGSYLLLAAAAGAICYGGYKLFGDGEAEDMISVNLDDTI